MYRRWILKQNWVAWLQHKWSNELQAFDMEQRLLKLLRKADSVGERVRCSQKALVAAWQEALIG